MKKFPDFVRVSGALRSGTAGPRSRAFRAFALTAVVLSGFAGPAGAQQVQAPVRIDAVRDEPLTQTVPVIGRLVASQAGSVAARISGPILEYRVRVGDRVNAGDVIAVLDSSTMKAERDLGATGLAIAQATLNTRQAQTALARQELQRIEGLKQSAAFSQARFDDARQQVAIAEAAAREAEASVAAAQARLRLAEINLAYTEVKAPYDGAISRRLSEAGAYAREGDALVNMIAYHTLEVEADVPAARLAGLLPGTELTGRLDNGITFSATVRAIIPDENPLTRTRAVRFEPDLDAAAAAGQLANEQSATMQIPVGTPRRIVSVHKDAIIQRDGDMTVFKVVDGTAERVRIVIGEAVGNRFEILEGLNEGDLVVVRGNERLQPGMAVRVEGAS